MPSPTTSDGPIKDQGESIAQQRRGMNRLNSGLPAPHGAVFTEEAARQAVRLSGRPEEAEALAFIDAAFAWPTR